MQLCGGNFGGLWRYRLPIYAFVCPHAGKWYTDVHHRARDACGFTATASDEGAKLVFDGAEAAFGTLEGLGLSPMTAPELLAEAWETGYIQYTGLEDGLLHVTYLCGYDEDEYRADTWFQNGAPVRAELSCDGQMAVQIDVTDFNLRKAETNNESTQTNMG